MKIDAPKILMIAAAADTQDLPTALNRGYGFVVDVVDSAQVAVQQIRQVEPDLLLLWGSSTSASLLAELTRLEMTLPVIVIDPDNKISLENLKYPHIVGWLRDSFTTSAVADLISTRLGRAAPAPEAVEMNQSLPAATHQQLAHRVEELETLFEIGKSVISQLDLSAVLRFVVTAAVNLTGADEGYLLLIDENSGDLYLRAESNLGEAAQNFRVKVKDSISGYVVESGRPLTLSRHDSSLKIKTGLTVYALINVPLRIGAEVIGVLGVNNRHQQRLFTVDDEKLLSALADWAAIAIQNARLYADVRQFSRDLRLVTEVSQLVTSTLDVEQIPRLLLQRTAEIIGAECGSLALIDEGQGGVVFQLAYDDQGRELKGLRNFLMPLGSGIVGLVAQTGQPIIVNDAQNHPAWSSLSDQMTGFTTRKLIAVPLIAEGEILGVVELLNKIEGDFVRNDIQLLSAVAASAATAIQNARQYEALKQTNRALEEAHQQRIAAERWTVLGKAAANLAHRINNSTALVPLAAQHVAELLRPVDLEPELRQEITRNLDRIRRNSLYTVELAQVLLRRFRKHPTEARDINRLVAQALSLVEVPAQVKVMRHLDPDLPPVDTSDLLVEAFVELISNAVRVMTEENSLLRVATFRVGQDHVSIQITDNGPGIRPEDIEKIFNMFYTTSATGLGFGLWWVKTFLEQQHGTIVVESQPDKNTTFTITLPRHLPPLHALSK